jgi:nitroreductase
MITADQLYELLRTRRSVRRFRVEAPPHELIERVLEAAVTAPSASNKQPWRFVVVRNAPTIAAMATAVRVAVERIASAIDQEFQGSFRAYGDYFTRFEHAPVVIVPLFRALTILSNLTSERLGGEDASRIASMERNSGLIGTSLAIENLLLAAHASGLGASGMTGPLVAVDRIRELLNVAPSWEVAALIPIGYPDESPEATQRKPAERVTQWLD